MSMINLDLLVTSLNVIKLILKPFVSPVENGFVLQIMTHLFPFSIIAEVWGYFSKQLVTIFISTSPALSFKYMFITVTQTSQRAVLEIVK